MTAGRSHSFRIQQQWRFQRRWNDFKPTSWKKKKKKTTTKTKQKKTKKKKKNNNKNKKKKKKKQKKKKNKKKKKKKTHGLDLARSGHCSIRERTRTSLYLRGLKWHKLLPLNQNRSTATGKHTNGVQLHHRSVESTWFVLCIQNVHWQ